MSADCVGASRFYDGDGIRAAETYDAGAAALMVARMRRKDAYRTADPLPARVDGSNPRRKPRRAGRLYDTRWNERFPR